MKLKNKTTGEICEAEAREDGIYLRANWSDEEKWFKYELSLLAGGWEYYVEPKEPLIKDERIRQAVRVWAEINSIDEVLYAERTDRSLFCLTDMGVGDYAIEFVGWVPTLKDGTDYTIAELCGDSKEDKNEA